MKRTLLSLAVAAIAAAAPFLAPAQADAAIPQYVKLCAGGVCFYKRDHLYRDGGKQYYFLRFYGSAITHYNVRYTAPGGRTTQIEVGAVSGSNESGHNIFRNLTPGGKYTVSVQACNRGGFLQSSKCTGWMTFTFYGGQYYGAN